jgi:hypothetical protein
LLPPQSPIKARSTTKICHHKIEATPTNSSITLSKVGKSHRSQKVESGQPFKRPCDEVWVAKLERLNFKSAEVTLKGDLGIEPGGVMNAHVSQVTLEPDLPSLTPTPETSPSPATPKAQPKKTWRERQKEQKQQEREQKKRTQRSQRGKSASQVKAPTKASTSSAPAQRVTSPQEKPTQEKPTQEKPTQEKPTQDKGGSKKRLSF